MVAFQHELNIQLLQRCGTMIGAYRTSMGQNIKT